MGISIKAPSQVAAQAKDTASPALTPGKEEAAAVRRDAVCIELPVVVYGSGYTSLIRNRAEHIGPFREETQTMIVFPQGAVVRLSAKVESGETVVVTNRKTGQEVLTRVVSVKAPGTVKGYAEIEFTQSAPGFWGISFPSDPPRSWSSLPVASAEIAPATAPPPEPVPSASAATLPERDEPSFVAPPYSAPAESSVVVSGLFAIPETHRSPTSRRTWLMVSLGVVLAVAAGITFLRYRSAQVAETPPAAASAEEPSAVQAATESSTPGNAEPPQVAATNASASAARPSPVVVPEGSKTGPSRVGHELEGSRSSASPEKSRKPTEPASRRFSISEDNRAAPVVLPTGPAAVGQEAPPPVVLAEVPGVSSGKGDNVLAAIVPGAGRTSAVPPVPKGPVRVGGPVKEPRLLSSVQPSYPPLAKQRGIEGDVSIEVVIDTAGKVTEMKVVSGPMLLRQVAMDALRQSRYEPTRINGQLVATKTVVKIHFRLH